jgi:excisionase family DNA binding protein
VGDRLGFGQRRATPKDQLRFTVRHSLTLRFAKDSRPCPSPSTAIGLESSDHRCRPKSGSFQPKKAADRLDVSLGQVRKFIAGGRLIGYKVGRLLKVDVNQVDALVETIDNS